MAEIKSTLELALERTQKMRISGEDREEMKRKEIEQKAKALSNRYREEHLPLNEVLKETERMDEKTSARVKEVLLSQWIDALSLKDEDERLIKAIEAIKNRNAEELRQKHQRWVSRYRGEKERVKEEITTKIIETLKKEGIEGSAVEPHTEADPLWIKEKETLDQRYDEKLKEIKEQLRNLSKDI